MSVIGKWLDQSVGKWLGTSDGAAPGPTYIDAELIVEGRGSSILSAIGGVVAAVGGWLPIFRRRRR